MKPPPEKHTTRRELPIIMWLRRSTSASLRADALAGFTTAVLLVPQAMAYAILAGLPVHVGLYAAIIPPLIYALLGTARPLAIGPVALDSLLTAGIIGSIAVADSDAYLAMAAMLAIFVGAVQLSFGLLGLGFLVRLLSRPILSGFISAGAIIIALNQLKLVLGIPIPRSAFVPDILYALLQMYPNTNLLALFLGCSTLMILAVLKRTRPLFPRALFVVLIGTISSQIWPDLWETVGAIPMGLPTFKLPEFDFQHAQSLLIGAVAISLVSLMEATSVAAKLKRPEDPKIDPNRELLALGGANLATGFFQGFPVSAGLSRSAVSDSANAQSPLSGIVTSLIVLGTLIFLAPALEPVPKTVLGAIIISAVLKLIDVKEGWLILQLSKKDSIIYGVTLLSTLLVGIQEGIALGVVMGLILYGKQFREFHFYISEGELYSVHISGSLNYWTVHKIISAIDAKAHSKWVIMYTDIDSSAHQILHAWGQQNDIALTLSRTKGAH